MRKALPNHGICADEEWQIWFAWYPVSVSKGLLTYRVWLEFVERRWRDVGQYESDWIKQYRLI